VQVRLPPSIVAVNPRSTRCVGVRLQDRGHRQNRGARRSMQRDYRRPGPFLCTMAPHHGLRMPTPVRRGLKPGLGEGLIADGIRVR